MKKYSLHIVLLIGILVSVTSISAQNTPKLVVQAAFDLGLGDVQSNTAQKHFLVISDNNYTLIDQASKIQLGTLVFDAGSWGAQGVGKTALMDNGQIIISTGFVLLKADPITGDIDTLFNQIKYPEIIENFTLWPNEPNKILIHTKTYPLKKDSSISFLSDNKEHREYLGPVNCKMYLFDLLTQTTIQVATTPHLITTFAPEAYNGAVLAGTLDGDVVSINTELQQTTLFRAFDTAVHKLLLVDDAIIVVPSIAQKFISNNYGDGRIFIYKNGKCEKELSFAPQEPMDENSMLGPSAQIYRVFYYNKTNSVLVNYGFSRLVSINLNTYDTSHFSIPYNMAKFYCWGTHNRQLLASNDDVQNMFATSRRQDLFDIESKKFQPAFRPILKQDKYTQFYKIFDERGNYHIIAHKQGYGLDTLVVFSSNTTQPITIVCKGNINIDEKNNLIGIEKYGRIKAGYLLYNKMRQSNYTIDYYNSSEIFQEVFLPDNIKTEDQLTFFAQIIPGYFVLEGENNVVIMDSTGKNIFEVNITEKLYYSNTIAISPSRKYIAIADGGNNKHSIAVWDWQAGKKVFTKTWDKDIKIQHFTFDKTLDVLWLNTHRWTKGNNRDLINEIYSINITNVLPKAQLMFTDPRFFSFEVDMQADRVAFEAYSELYLAKLSTLQLLWQHAPRSDYFNVSHIKNGFCFSTQEELYNVINDTTQLYFTSYAGRKPIEVANNYLYKGDKSAINNLAFVYQGKAYLPAEYDVYFNRPDVVSTLSGSTNQEFNTVLSEAFAKRTRKVQAVSIEDLLGKSPIITISNKTQLPLVITDNNIVLDIEGKSVYQNINRLHIIANGVPIFGSGGYVLSPSKNINSKQKIVLQKGNNILQVYITDEKGIPSATETINIVADYTSPEPKTYFVGIGIDVFEEKGHNLSYSVKDIRDLANAFKTKFGNAVIIDTLFNKNVSVENVKALRHRMLQAGVNDRVIISYSGHGMLDKQLNYYLSTYSVNFSNPAERGLPYTYFENLLDSLPARKKLLLIDACHSGEVDKEALENMRVVFGDTSKHISDGGKSGIELIVDEEQTVGLKNSFELMQEVFTDVSRGTGATVLSAAAGTQVAYEKGELQNGVFTYCILQLMDEKNTCTVQELKTYVGEQVEQRTNGLQKPTSRNETMGFDWQVW